MSAKTQQRLASETTLQERAAWWL